MIQEISEKFDYQLKNVEINSLQRINKSAVNKIINQYADIFGFTLYNMGYRVLPEKTVDKIKG